MANKSRAGAVPAGQATDQRNGAAATARSGGGRFEREDRDAVSGSRNPAGDSQQRQREEFGGLKWGAAFFGWLVAIAIATLLTAILSAAGAAVGLTQGADTQDATANADTIGIVGGIVLLAILALAYLEAATSRGACRASPARARASACGSSACSRRSSSPPPARSSARSTTSSAS